MDVWLHQKKPHDHCYNPCITHWETSVLLHIFFFVISAFPWLQSGPTLFLHLLLMFFNTQKCQQHSQILFRVLLFSKWKRSNNGWSKLMFFFPFTLWLYDSSAQSDMCQTSYCAAWYLFNLTMSIWLVFTAWLQYLNFYKPCLFICRQVVLFGNFNNKTCLSWKCSSTLKILFSHSDSMTLPWVQLETVHSVLLFLLPVN